MPLLCSRRLPQPPPTLHVLCEPRHMDSDRRDTERVFVNGCFILRFFLRAVPAAGD